MYTAYQLNANDLNENFIQSVKSLFQDKMIEIAICDIANIDYEDETDYLLKTPANRIRLLTAIENMASGCGLVEYNLPQP